MSTDKFISQLVVNTEGKTDCQQWHTDGWGCYEGVFSPEVRHVIGKDQAQQLGSRLDERKLLLP